MAHRDFDAAFYLWFCSQQLSSRQPDTLTVQRLRSVRQVKVWNNIGISSSAASRGRVGHGTQGLRRSVLPLVLLATVVLAATRYAHGSAPPLSSSSEGQRFGKILSVRKVLRNQYFGSRYPQIHYCLLYFAVGSFDQTYCAQYETPVLEEIGDLFSAKDKDVEFVLRGKSLTLRTPNGRKFKARLLEQKQC
jgi:hypothetical protein